jgi:GNAT superfamily N-acetyltransferase
VSTVLATTPSGAAIRTAVPGDVTAIFGLMRELAQFEKLTDIFVATEAGVHDALFGPRAFVEALVAERGGAIVAYALFFHSFSTFLGRRGLYLEDLYVQPAQRGSGLGTEMLRALAALALERQCGRFEWTVLDWNQPAIDFYEKMGATVLPDWRVVRMTGDALEKLARGDAEPAPMKHSAS